VDVKPTTHETSFAFFLHPDQRETACSSAGDRSPIGSPAGGVFAGHQTQKATQLADVLKLSLIPDAGQKLARHNPADAGNRHQVLYTLGQLWIILKKAADLSGRLKDLLLVKFQAVEQLIRFKARRPEQGSFRSLSFIRNDH
jgi:hypothetical protein